MARHTTWTGAPPPPRQARSLPYRAAARVRDVLGDAVFDALIGFGGCLLLGAAAIWVAWGWNRHPGATAIAATSLALLFGLGVMTMARPGTHRGAVATMAGGGAVVLLAWLSYVGHQCACL